MQVTLKRKWILSGTAGLRTFDFNSSQLKQTKQDAIVPTSSKLMEAKVHLAQGGLNGTKRPPRQLHGQNLHSHKRRTSAEKRLISCFLFLLFLACHY